MAGEVYSKPQIENLITILAHDATNGKIVARLIEPQLFEPLYRDIAERCIKYWKQFKTCPGVHTADLFSDVLAKPDSRMAKPYQRTLRNMQLLSEGINTEYVLNTLRETKRWQLMKVALLKAAELTQKQGQIDIAEAEQVLSQFVRAREFQFNGGLRLGEVDRVLDYLSTHYNEFTTGVEILDREHIVPARGAVMLFLAPTRRGKSWFGINCGKNALLQRKRVLHVTLEMSEEEVGARYYQNLFALPKHKGGIEITTLEVDEHGRFAGRGEQEVFSPKVSFDGKAIGKTLRARLKFWQQRGMTEKLVIKRFPNHQMSMDMLRGYIDVLESTTGFTPDLIVLDYIGITKIDARDARGSLGRNMGEFRAVCIDYNAAGVTMQQSSKAGEKAYQVKIDHVAEDWSLIGTADMALTFSQTVEERRLGLARLWVDKARSEADNWGLVITQNYATGQFALQGAKLNRAYHRMVEELGTRAEEDEAVEDEAE